jgi:hypothetical protein
MANKYMKKCSASLAIQGMQIKTTLRFHLTPVKETTANAGEGAGERGSSYTVGGNVNWHNHYRNQYGGSSKKLAIDLPSEPSIPLLRTYPKSVNQYTREIPAYPCLL